MNRNKYTSMNTLQKLVYRTRLKFGEKLCVHWLFVGEIKKKIHGQQLAS